MLYFIIRNGQQMGPFTIEQLRTMGLTASTPIWLQGTPNWRCASEIAELQGYLLPEMPPPYGPQGYARADIGLFDAGPSGKSRGVAGLFAILLGGLGVHYFYMGKVGGGFICILLTIITCGLWSVVSLIMGIMMLTMRQEEFERKYINSPSTFPLF